MDHGRKYLPPQGGEGERESRFLRKVEGERGYFCFARGKDNDCPEFSSQGGRRDIGTVLFRDSWLDVVTII